MIADLSHSLRALLGQPGLPPALAAAAVVFDRPTEPFAPTQTTLDLFLHDIRENRDLAPSSPQGGARRRALACSYLVTAWPVGGMEPALQEQELLGEALQVLARYPSIPARFLHGALAGHTPLPQMLPLHPDAMQSTAEFWTSLGTRLRPSLSLTVTLALPVVAAET
jgi:Pvc16 N-terminal domain